MTKKRARKTEEELGITALELEELRKTLQEAPAPTRLPEGSRQILIVEGAVLTSASWVERTGVPTKAMSVVMLRGRPSPSSDRSLTLAYLTFVPEPAPLRAPTFGAGVIRLFMRPAMLSTVLAQVKSKNVFCWVGQFADGHLYGDVHAAD